MNDAQTWTLIAGFFALMVTMISLTLRAVRAEITGLREGMDGRFTTLEARLDHMNRDLQAVMNRLMEG